jgi:hypothetical protein
MGEGGVSEPARRGTFSTGSSWWPFQLHYGGAGTPYASLGNVAGMGNDFTALTGWQPGDPAAWKDSVDYALDKAKAGGWGPWYGAAAAGIHGFDGISRALGGWITEPVMGIGLHSGRRWSFGEREAEYVMPRSRMSRGGGDTYITISMPHYLGDRAEVARALRDELARFEGYNGGSTGLN